MTPTEARPHENDDRCLSFAQLLVLITFSCGACLALARGLGMNWLPSIAFAYVGGAALVIVLCLLIMQMWEGGWLRPLAQADGAGPGPAGQEDAALEMRLPTWHTGKTIDKHRRSPDVI